MQHEQYTTNNTRQKQHTTDATYNKRNIQQKQHTTEATYNRRNIQQTQHTTDSIYNRQTKFFPTKPKLFSHPEEGEGAVDFLPPPCVRPFALSFFSRRSATQLQFFLEGGREGVRETRASRNFLLIKEGGLLSFTIKRNFSKDTKNPLN